MLNMIAWFINTAEQLILNDKASIASIEREDLALEDVTTTPPQLFDFVARCKQTND
jgi:hypothetical protein